MEDQVLTFGLAAAIASSIAGSFIVWRMITTYTDKKVAEVRLEHEVTKNKLSALELKVVTEHPTQSEVGTMVARVESVIEKLIDRLDNFASAFNAALVELAISGGRNTSTAVRKKTNRKVSKR